jgi:hypothetical protein
MSGELRGFARAQREWEAREPSDGGVCECSECNGNGTMPAPGDPEGDYVECSACKGFGRLTPDGEPFDPDAAERAADEVADHKRDDHNLGD